MKFISTCAMLLALISFNVVADDHNFDHTEHNWSVKHNSWKFDFRNDIGLEDGSYHHLEGQYAINDRWTVRLRRADSAGTIEWRPRVVTKLYKWNDFTLASDIEYRSFEGDKDSYFRFRPYVQYKTKLTSISDDLGFVAKAAPRWEVGKEGSDDGYADTKVEFGLPYKINDNFTAGPFMKMEFNESSENDYWLGTNVVLTF